MWTYVWDLKAYERIYIIWCLEIVTYGNNNRIELYTSSLEFESVYCDIQGSFDPDLCWFYFKLIRSEEFARCSSS